ncbi:FAD:protein FMN transferase [Candidatus Methylocalor cossyra]|uniref:FAD:protein FMN transferase n=1 Tax=Candidatus Methylocalor cossyra TaxID=3108543 RepID=A0ABP1C793_9GAMM
MAATPHCPFMSRYHCAFALLGLVLLSACQAPTETELTGAIQGTSYHIKLVLAGLPVTVDQVKADIEETFRQVDEKLSNWREDSEISRINAQKTSDWLPVSPELATVLAIARSVHDRSGGCYDLTVKPIFDLWGFSKHAGKIPEPAAIDRALAHVGMDKLELDEAQRRLRKLDPALEISLDSIAQGYTVAAVAERLERRGIHNYLAEIGGEMKVKGKKANGQPWRVAIEKPTPFTREVQRVLDIQEEKGTAVMTAGTYRNFFQEQGQTYSHILNPKTGRPVTHNLLSVTVLHEDPTWADAWDTALLCVGETEGAKLAEAEHLKALFIYRDGSELKERMSSAFLAEPPAQR